MKKYVFILSLVTCLLATALTAEAKETGKTWKIGVLLSGTASINATRDEALRTGLRQLGYEEGKNIAIAYQYGEGKPDRLPNLAKELVAEKP